MISLFLLGRQSVRNTKQNTDHSADTGTVEVQRNAEWKIPGQMNNYEWLENKRNGSDGE